MTAPKTRENRYLSDISKIDWWDRASKLFNILGTLCEELFYGIKSGTIPWVLCLNACSLIGALFLIRADQWAFRKLQIESFYPTDWMKFWSYWIIFMSAPFLVWGLAQVKRRREFLKSLGEAFVNSGLKSPLGKVPSLISDHPLDEHTRKLKVKKNGMSLSDFNSAQEKLESCLQIYIDEFKEHREGGSLEMIYSHTKMSELIPFERLQEIKPIHFLVGNTRSGQLFASLKKIPHLLVAGVTGQGKSTFLRQVITTFYVRNSKWHFTLIDLKEGVVFQTFEDLPRVEVINNMPSAVGSLEVLLKALEERMQILKASGCENIDEYLSLPKEKKKRPEKCQQSLYFDRHIVVIDEIAVMFLAGLHSDAKKIQRSRSIVNKLAAQGRAAGIHVIAATQRPDARSLDTQIKANLPGVLCFHMANNASSMTVLDNGRATDIAPVEGRAVWKHGSKLIEVQTPFLPKEEAEAILAPYRLENAENDNTHKATEPEVVEGSAPALQTDQTPVDSDLDLNE